MYVVFVRARRALNGQKRRFPARAEKAKKTRVVPRVADRQRLKSWTDEELADFCRMLKEEGPGDWASKGARLTARHGVPLRDANSGGPGGPPAPLGLAIA